MFALLSDSGLSVCDYIFPNESAADVAERFKEMLGCEVSEGDVDTSTEAQSNFLYFLIMHDVLCFLWHQALKVPKLCLLSNVVSASFTAILVFDI